MGESAHSETSTIGAERDPRTPFGERFEQRGELGRGSMSVVFGVFDREQCRELALKSMVEVGGSDLVTLKEEFRSLRDLSHPNIIELEELFVESERCFFTMDLVYGVDIVTAFRSEREGETDDQK